MAVYQLRLSNGLNLKSWIRKMALELEGMIPAGEWPAIYPNKGVRVLILSKALRQGALARMRAFEACGSQVQCDEACVPVSHNLAKERFAEGEGMVPLERYRVLCHGAPDFARDLVRQILWRIPDAAPHSKELMRFLTDEISNHLFINELCGLTDLCSYSMPRDLAAETTRDPGPAELETAT